jgi:hypothetical protein
MQRVREQLKPCKHCHDFWHTLGRQIGKYPVGKMASLV